MIPNKDLINEDGDLTTPFKIATSTKPPVSQLCMLFCPCVVWKATAHVGTKALNIRHQAQEGFFGIFVVIPQHHKGYPVYVPITRKIIYSYDVVFDEKHSSALAYTSQPYSEAMDMRPSVKYTPYATSSKGKNGNILTSAQVEEGSLLSETCDNAEMIDESNDNSIIPPLIREEEMDEMDSRDESDDEPTSTEMLQDIRDRSQTHSNVTRREARYKIRDRIKQIQLEWKGALKSTQNVGKGLRKVFKTVVKYISQNLPPLGESGSESSYFIPEPRNFSEVTKLSYYIKKPCIKANQKWIKNIIDHQTFLVQEPEKDEPVKSCMNVLKTRIQSNGSLDKLKLSIMVRGDIQNKELVGDTWSPAASMRNCKYFLADAAKHRAREYQLDFIGAFLQAKVKNRVFVKLDSRYADYFSEYSNYFGRTLRLL